MRCTSSQTKTIKRIEFYLLRRFKHNDRLLLVIFRAVLIDFNHKFKYKSVFFRSNKSFAMMPSGTLSRQNDIESRATAFSQKHLSTK